jgi:septum formation protein
MIVLSSSSPVRRQLLRQAGLRFKTARHAFDEAQHKIARRRAGASAEQVARELAESKAGSLTERLPGAFVIGADQMLECDGVWFDKPADAADARRQLLALRGKTHRLISALAVTGDGKLLWSYAEGASLTMRNFSDLYLDLYLQALGPEALQTVGAYHFEGLGAQLFERVQGDYFTILGLPLLPLLGALREIGALPR